MIPGNQRGKYPLIHSCSEGALRGFSKIAIPALRIQVKLSVGSQVAMSDSQMDGLSLSSGSMLSFDREFTAQCGTRDQSRIPPLIMPGFLEQSFQHEKEQHVLSSRSGLAHLIKYSLIAKRGFLDEG